MQSVQHRHESVLLRRLGSQGVRRNYRRAEALFLEGDIADRVFLLERGYVKITASSGASGDAVLGLRGPGDIVGELSALDHAPRSASAIALGKVEAVVIAAGDFTRSLREDAEVAYELLAELAARLRDADRKRAEFGAQDTLARVARRLVELSEQFGDRTPEGIRVDLPLTQEELAAWCGASREATVKALKTLRTLGIVTTGRRVIVIRDAVELAARAGAAKR